MKKQRKLDNILEEIHQLCDKKNDVPLKLKRELDHYCRKRYFFDIIYFFNGKSIHSSVIKVISESFLNGDKELGILFLFFFLHQTSQDDLIFDAHEFFGIQLDGFDAHLYIIIAKYIMKLDLPSNEFKTFCEYFLRRVVVNLFISDIRDGTGDFFEGWDTKNYYGHLLTNKFDFEKDEISFNPDTVKKVVSLFAQKFHEHDLVTLVPTYDYSYSCIENEFWSDFFNTRAYDGSKDRFIAWQRSQKILPEFLMLIRSGFIIAEEGVLYPDLLKLFSRKIEEEVIFHTNYGIFDLTQAVHVLKSIMVEDYVGHAKDYIDYKYFNKFKKGYLEWHRELGLLDDLKKRFAYLITSSPPEGVTADPRTHLWRLIRDP